MTATDLHLLGDWQTEANCIGTDPELFFPERGVPLDDAKSVCHGCSVRWECLETALANREDHGIWGGLTAPERRRIRDGRTRVRPVPTPA